MWRGSPSSRSTREKNRSKPEPVAQQRDVAQLGQVAHRHPGVAGPDVRERLGDRVDLGPGHAERSADVADGVADPVGLHHRHRGAALPAVPVEDRVVDLQPPRGLHVDVDVGQRLAQRGEEALHDQAVPDRVDPGDAEQVVDQTARSRAAGSRADAQVADQVGDVGDGQEVRRVAELVDDLQLVVEPLPDPLSRGVRRTAARSRPRTAPAAPGWPSPLPRTPGSAPTPARGRSGDRPRTGRPASGSRPSAVCPRRTRARRRAGRSPRRPRPSACRTSRTLRRCRGRRAGCPAGPAAGPRRGRR